MLNLKLFDLNSDSSFRCADSAFRFESRCIFALNSDFDFRWTFRFLILNPGDFSFLNLVSEAFLISESDFRCTFKFLILNPDALFYF